MEASDYDVVLTLYDKKTDFSAFKHYILPDTIIHLVEEGDTSKISREYDEEILALVDANLGALGYNKTTDTDVADFYMLCAVTTKEHYNIYSNYYYGYWGWYWGYYLKKPNSANSYFYYPWYGPGYTTVTKFTSGTLIMSIVDAKDIDLDNEKITVHWLGSTNGILVKDKDEVRRRLASGINQAFEQSPYLGTN